MAISTKGLSGPDDIAFDGKRGNLLGYAPSGSVAAPPKWEVGNPAAVAMAGLQKASERFAAVWDDVQVNDYLLKKRKELDDYYNNPDTGAFRTRQRDKAQGMYGEYRDMTRKMWDEDAPKHLNERQMGKATKPFAALFQDYGHKVGSFETEQLMDAQVDKAKNAVFEAQNLIASGDLSVENLGPSFMSITNANKALAHMQRWDEKTTERMTKEAFGDAVLKGAAARAATDPMMALGAVRLFGKYMPEAERQAALGVLDGKVRDFKKQRYLELVGAGMVEEADKFLLENSPRGVRNNNPGNIVKTSDSWEGEISGADAKFKSFTTPEHGIAAIGKNLLAYADKGVNTVNGIINRWAPPSENDTDAYVTAAARELHVSPDAKLDLKDPAVLTSLTRAIIRHENGGVEYSDEQIRAGVEAAFGKRKLPSPKPDGTLLADAGTAATDAGGGYRPGTGMLKPSDVRQLQKQGKEIIGRQKENDAYQFLYSMDHEDALKYVASPDGQKALGLDAKQAKSVSEMLHTQWTHINAVEKKEREKYETDVMTTATNMAIGAKEQPADPVRALQMINESDLDGKTKLELRKALQNGTIDQDAPAFVVGIKSRIAGGGPPVTEAELARGIAGGQLSFATKDKLVKLQESVAGPQGEIIKSAFKALDEAFKKSMMADGTPAQALAHFAAQNELQLAVAEGLEKGNILDLLNPQSKNFILPGIMQRHQLSMTEQVQAMGDRISGGEQVPKTIGNRISGGEQVPKTMENRISKGEQTPQRKAGESVTDYLRRISGGTQ